MKESIGATQIFLLVIALILIFSGIMALTINRSNAFAVKDQIVSIIETEGKFDMTSEIVAGKYVGDCVNKSGSKCIEPALQQIVDVLDHNSYRQTGRCPESSTGKKVISYQRNGSKVSGNNKASFCILQIDGNSPAGAPPVYYYEVIVFYTLDLPIVNEAFNFHVKGQTKSLSKF